jgi:hypothetical protein
MKQHNTVTPMGADVQPSSITELEPILKEFVDKLKTVENEIDLLTTQRKELWEEYAEKVDTKTLKLALRVAKIKDKVEHKDTFDTFEEIILNRIGV